MPQYSPDTLTGQTGTIHSYVIAATGDYWLEAWGAQGGGVGGGKGAHCAGVFPLVIADTLWVTVGQRPAGVSGGGGATTISKGATLAGSTILLSAAGGGGCGNLPWAEIADGRAPIFPATAVDGNTGQGASGSAGGTAGAGGAEAAAAAAPAAIAGSGGGFVSAGGRGRYAGALVTASGGDDLDDTCIGGVSINGSALTGGFGGGGGGYELGAGLGYAGGGGGGYNGGGGAYWTTGSTSHRGGGGGSYNVGSDVINESGEREGAGYAIVQQYTLPPAPVNVTATVTGHEVTVTWDSPPGDSVWDDDDAVVAEVERIDCFGTHEVAVVQPGYSGSAVDLFAPLTQPTGAWCGDTDHTCSIQYRVRYRGVIVRTLDAPDLAVPDGAIVGWPETVASIPAGWSRVAALDSKYIKEVPTPATAPGTTGGSATHTHTTPGHVHNEDHYHTQGNTPGNGSCVGIYSEAGWPSQRPCSHVHTSPDTNSAYGVNSGSTAPALEAASSDLARKSYVFIESDGTPAGIPTNGIALWNSATPPTGWDEENDDGADVAARPPFLHGASVGSDGTRTMDDYATHTHHVADHTHTGTSHTHTSPNTGTATSYYLYAPPSGPIYFAGPSHTHSITVAAALTAALNSVSGGTSGPDVTTTDNDPLWRAQTWVENTGAAALPLGIICLWLSDLASIPATWQVCDGTNGTPNLSQGKFMRHRGGQPVGTTGGGTGHSHTTPNHTHTSAGHTHTVTYGSSSSSAQGTLQGVPPGISRATTGHTHGSSTTTGTSTTGLAANSGTSGATLPEPPYVETTFIMLVSTDTSALVEPYTTYSEWSDESPIITIPNTSPGMLWMRDPVDGEVAICPPPAWERSRPLTATQAVEGGIPSLVTGTPGGRDYTLVIPCVDRTTRALAEDILAAPLFWVQPFDAPPVWLTVESERAEQTTVRGISVITARCIAVDPEPLDDPEDLLP